MTPASPGARPPIGVQLYTVRDDLAADPAGTLRRLAELGLRHVEPYDLVAWADRLAEPLAALGIAAPTSHASFVDGGLDAVLDAAERLGVGMVIEPWVPEERWATPGGIAAIARGLNEAARRAAERGIGVGYHNHWFELEQRFNGVTGLELLASQLDDGVRLELDAYWCAVGGADPAAILERLGDRVVALHLKDGPISRDTSLQVPAGSGRLPVDAVLATAPVARPIVEFDAYAGDLYQGIAEAITFLQGRGLAL